MDYCCGHVDSQYRCDTCYNEPEYRDFCKECKGTGWIITSEPCSSKAEWYRITQFAGKHPYCDRCAREEPDFGIENGSYYFWQKIEGFKGK